MNLLERLLLAAAMTGATLLPTAAVANLGESETEESGNADWVAGKKAVESQDWQTAADRLSKAAAAEPKNADIQNWLGFSQRKLGNLDAAFAAYGEALKLNPKHKAAHEYIGEAYLMAGKVDKAEQHLAELQRLCTPIPCEELKQLKRAVEDYKKSKK
jgi:Flp pilus assembly protein TadD